MNHKKMYQAINVKQSPAKICMYVRVSALILIARMRARVLIKIDIGNEYKDVPSN